MENQGLFLVLCPRLQNKAAFLIVAWLVRNAYSNHSVIVLADLLSQAPCLQQNRVHFKILRFCTPLDLAPMVHVRK